MEPKEVGGSFKVSENKAERMATWCIRHKNQAAWFNQIGLAVNVVTARDTSPTAVSGPDGFDAVKARKQMPVALLS